MTLLGFMGEHPVLTVILFILLRVWLEGIIGTICSTIAKRK